MTEAQSPPDMAGVVERLEAYSEHWRVARDLPHPQWIEDLRALLSAFNEREWQDIASAPRDGTPFYARHQSPYRFQPYKPTSEQYRHGKRGRWQAMNEYGGWENCPEPVGDWKPHPDFPVRRTALTHSPETDGEAS